MPHAVAPRSVRQDRATASDRGVGVIDPQERIDVLLAHLRTRASGLSSREAERRVAPVVEDGPSIGGNSIVRADGCFRDS